MTTMLEKHRHKIEFDSPGGCWIWTAGKFWDGYGAVWVGGKVRRAHRVAYEDRHGPESMDGLVIRHRCDVRACCNPDHLEVGTHADNARDKIDRGRNVVFRGAAHSMAKLTEADVRAIRQRRASGETYPSIAKDYPVSTGQVRRVAIGEKYILSEGKAP